MSNVTTLCPFENVPDWKIDPTDFVHKLNQEWPEIKVYRASLDADDSVLEWTMYSQGYPFACWLAADFQTIYAETGWCETLLSLAMWYRRLVPDSISLFMFTPERYTAIIVPTMTLEELRLVTRGGNPPTLLSNLSQMSEAQIREYVSKLENRWSEERLEAIEVLCHLGKRVIPFLLESLNKSVLTEPNYGVCKVFGRLGKVSVPYLVEAFDSSGENARPSIILALKYIGASDGVPTLIKALADPNPQVIKTTAMALTELGIGAQSALVPLLEKLSYPLEEVKIEIIKALGAIGDPLAFEPLLPLLENRGETNDIRLLTSHALAQTGRRRAIDPLFKALKDANQELVGTIFSALELIYGETELQRLSELLYDERHSQGAARLLAKLGEVAVPPLKSAFLKLPDKPQALLAEALGRVGKPAITPLLEILHSALEKNTRINAMLGLKEIKEPELIDTFISYLDDAETDIRMWAAHALAHFQEPEVNEALLWSLKDSEAKVRDAAHLSLARNEYGDIFEIALKYTNDLSPDVRSIALSVLGDTGKEEALAVLDFARKNDPIKDKWGIKVSTEASRAWEKLSATLSERKKGS